MTRSRITRTVAAVVLTGALALGTTSAMADDDPFAPPRPPEGGVDETTAAESVDRFEDPEAYVDRFDPSDDVEPLGEEVESEGRETTINLSTDLLFSVNSWELPAGAPERIAELVEEVPEGATVRVTGHTDSRPTGEGFDNQELSEHRAGAVAEALRSERGDLSLEVSGRGDSEPAEAEDPEDPATYEANRRVEIIYSGG